MRADELRADELRADELRAPVEGRGGATAAAGKAAILSEDFELSIDYQSGTVGAAIQGLLKSEGHRSRKEGLAKFRKDRGDNEQPSLARLCSCSGKNEIRKLLK